MTPVHLHKVLEKDGEIVLKGLPFEKGQHVDLVVFPGGRSKSGKRYPKLKDLIECGLIGMWEDREDIKDSVVFARQLRERAQRRQG